MSNQILSIGKSFFGAEVLKNLIDEIKESNFQRILIISSPDFQLTLKKISTLLAKNRIVYNIFEREDITPSLSTIRSIVETGKIFRADAIISVGTNAIADISKATSFLLANQEISDPRKLEGNIKAKTTMPLYQFFCSIGNARTTSTNFIIEDEANRRKLYCKSLIPIATATFFDITTLDKQNISIKIAALIASAVDCIISKDSWNLSTIYALQALKLLSKSSPSMGNLYFAQYFLGLASGSCSATLETAIADSLESYSNISSDLVSAILLPQVMELNATSTGEKYRDIALALGAKVSSTAKPDAFRKIAISSIKKLFKQLSVPKKIQNLSLSKDDLSFLQGTILKNSYTEANPKTVTKKKILELLKSLM